MAVVAATQMRLRCGGQRNDFNLPAFACWHFYLWVFFYSGWHWRGKIDSACRWEIAKVAMEKNVKQIKQAKSSEHEKAGTIGQTPALGTRAHTHRAVNIDASRKTLFMIQTDETYILFFFWIKIDRFFFCPNFLFYEFFATFLCRCQIYNIISHFQRICQWNDQLGFRVKQISFFCVRIQIKDVILLYRVSCPDCGNAPLLCP